MTDQLEYILGYLSAFCITCAIEIPVVYFLFRKAGVADRGRILKAGFLAQLLTHPTSFIIIPNLLYFFTQLLRLGNPDWIWPERSIAWYETAIALVEGLFYMLYLKPAKRYHAFIISILVNALSWGLGSLIPDYKWIQSLLGR
jgi:hypothetical protein